MSGRVGDDRPELIGCRIDRYVADVAYRQFIDDTQRHVRSHLALAKEPPAGR